MEDNSIINYLFIFPLKGNCWLSKSGVSGVHCGGDHLERQVVNLDSLLYTQKDFLFLFYAYMLLSTNMISFNFKLVKQLVFVFEIINTLIFNIFYGKITTIGLFFLKNLRFWVGFYFN